MKSSQKRKPIPKRQELNTDGEAKSAGGAQHSAEDARDLRDAERARAEAKRKGVYPWEWLKQEVEQ